MMMTLNYENRLSPSSTPLFYDGEQLKSMVAAATTTTSQADSTPLLPSPTFSCTSTTSTNSVPSSQRRATRAVRTGGGAIRSTSSHHRRDAGTSSPASTPSRRRETAPMPRPAESMAEPPMECGNNDDNDGHPREFADEQDQYPSVAVFDGIVRDYLQNLSTKKRDKALVDQQRYELILQVLQDQRNTALSTAQFRFWVKKMFRLSFDHINRVWLVCHDQKPVAMQEQIYPILVSAHKEAHHGGRDKTSALVRQRYSWIPKELIARFVRHCPFCISRRHGRMTRPRSSSSASASSISAPHRTHHHHYHPHHPYLSQAHGLVHHASSSTSSSSSLSPPLPPYAHHHHHPHPHQHHHHANGASQHHVSPASPLSAPSPSRVPEVPIAPVSSCNFVYPQLWEPQPSFFDQQQHPHHQQQQQQQQQQHQQHDDRYTMAYTPWPATSHVHTMPTTETHPEAYMAATSVASDAAARVVSSQWIEAALPSYYYYANTAPADVAAAAAAAVDPLQHANTTIASSRHPSSASTASSTLYAPTEPPMSPLIKEEHINDHMYNATTHAHAPENQAPPNATQADANNDELTVSQHMYSSPITAHANEHANAPFLMPFYTPEINLLSHNSL